MTACGYCFIFVEYFSKKAILYNVQSGELAAPVSAKLKLCSLI